MKYTRADQELVELGEIHDLILHGKSDEATNAYERWVFKWDHRVVDVGGTAHLKFHKPRWRRKGTKR